MLDSEPTPRQCEAHHDKTTLFISIFLCIGLVISYLPQHARIIINKTSDGFSAWFLLLGVISSTSSLLNIILLQWDAIVCCHSLSTGACVEGLMGVNQIFLQWAMFCTIFVLFLLYFPENKKHGAHMPSSLHLDLPSKIKPPISAEWKVSLIVAAVTTGHFVISVIISVLLLVLVGGPENWQTDLWAGFLGVFSMILATFQYLPQIWKTWKRKSVGALSIPMMCLQTPGSALFVYSLATRPGTNWTAWITYLITGLLQGSLLILCIVWHFRNKRLGLSDLQTQEPEPESTETTRLLRDNRI
ncbi:hypothetical protein J3Q64DRAFT_1714987 [Phycomyces blakesleeanus]|uniref:PQ loop repeat protein-like protein n=2 Tax=Phycomyces blakesleeanus TaxID=4837 RepID=A0A167QEK5_PHYB8|nr:hypothetical protein PHYBLDRAFT_27423 [Phycomyces blakesleeanus NRRL 1555(-)]OAD79588.1 hypothetical protein PHYBLDRAFT_27423 [Phycomyces blakesleeanus NRRL 1555(-)]|eukprot:XP_018297628.1 hypothetical protein PHYBLDRAFT_27423 [Phycomyces blakesleeanus NRRL 1555(-)]